MISRFLEDLRFLYLVFFLFVFFKLIVEFIFLSTYKHYFKHNFGIPPLAV